MSLSLTKLSAEVFFPSLGLMAAKLVLIGGAMGMWQRRGSMGRNERHETVKP
jgi:hypothetical protein